MGKVNNRDIYEIKPWLNDDKQNVDGLTALVGGGGGGDSDFSTARLTLINNTTYVFSMQLANVYGDDISTVVDTDDGEEFDVILYKGQVKTRLAQGMNVTTSGDVIVAGRDITITGDCTITITNA